MIGYSTACYDLSTHREFSNPWCTKDLVNGSVSVVVVAAEERELVRLVFEKLEVNKPKVS